MNDIFEHILSYAILLKLILTLLRLYHIDCILQEKPIGFIFYYFIWPLKKYFPN